MSHFHSERRSYQPPNVYPTQPELPSVHNPQDGLSKQVDFLTNYEAFLTVASDLLSIHWTYANESYTSEPVIRSRNMQHDVLKILPGRNLESFCSALEIHYNDTLKNNGTVKDQYSSLIQRCELVVGDYLRSLSRLQEDTIGRGLESGWKQDEFVYNDYQKDPGSEHHSAMRQNTVNQSRRNPSIKKSKGYVHNTRLREDLGNAGKLSTELQLDDKVYPMLSPTREGLSHNRNLANIPSEFHSTISPRSQRNLERSAELRKKSINAVADIENQSPAAINLLGNRRAVGAEKKIDKVYAMCSELSPEKTSTYQKDALAEDRVTSEGRPTADTVSSNTTVPTKHSSIVHNSTRAIVPTKHSSKVHNSARVMAPAKLPEDFAFEASIGDKIFMAVVPKGGVEKGEIFESPVIECNTKPEGVSRTKVIVDMEIPRMRWRDGLFSCLSNGLTHPILLNSVFCPQVALVQIMRRLHPTSLKKRVGAKSIGTTVLMLVILHFVLAVYLWRAFLYGAQTIFFTYGCVPILLADVALVYYFLFLLVRTRKEMRKLYYIPAQCILGDVLVSSMCTPCALSQMGRHTADYDTYMGRCCSETGLPPQIEVKRGEDHIYSGDTVTC